jgi:hypothetical protein
MRTHLGISAESLLEFMFQILRDINSCQKIIFPEGVSSAYTDISGKSGTWKGYMEYGSAILFKVKGKTWAVALGKGWSYGPVKHFICDIVAIQIIAPETKSGQQILDEIKNSICAGTSFRNSLFAAKQNGDLTASENPKNQFGKKMSDLLLLVVDKFTFQPEYNAKDFIGSIVPEDLLEGPRRFKNDFPDTLAMLTMEILAET